MPGFELWSRNSLSNDQSQSALFDLSSNSSSFTCGGIFLEPTISSSFVSLISSRSSSTSVWSLISCSKHAVFRGFRRERCSQVAVNGLFLSVSLRNNGPGLVFEPKVCLAQNGDEKNVIEEEKVLGRGNAFLEEEGNGMLGTFVAPLERLKLEYMVCGEQKHILDLIKTNASAQFLKGFWKGNLVNILRTAPFKAINFCAYDTYRKQLLRLPGNEEITNFERFIACAAAGITATILCIPLDTSLLSLLWKCSSLYK
ncbi:hypothetical protein GH714_025544 [Hevea brasiliensis]|uniref:ADP,ATP carrier protein n=1 Tax=Hevea brasiliensis TaxID=3981 RepID=A0A6A6KRC9_HEVBR|nr:hypothetical protein GH714_025544 [Hevea brasiliensis]